MSNRLLYVYVRVPARGTPTEQKPSLQHTHQPITNYGHVYGWRHLKYPKRRYYRADKNCKARINKYIEEVQVIQDVKQDLILWHKFLSVVRLYCAFSTV